MNHETKLVTLSSDLKKKQNDDRDILARLRGQTSRNSRFTIKKRQLVENVVEEQRRRTVKFLD